MNFLCLLISFGLFLVKAAPASSAQDKQFIEYAKNDD